MISIHPHSRETRADRTAEGAPPLRSFGGARLVIQVHPIAHCILPQAAGPMAFHQVVLAPRLARCPKCADPAGDVSARSCQEQSCPIRHDVDAIHGHRIVSGAQRDHG